MKRKSMASLFEAMAVLAVTSLNGCIVQSLHEFYTKETVVPLAHLWDEWDRVDHSEKYGVSSRPWEFGRTHVTTYEHETPGLLEVTYFRVGNNTFVDATAGELDSESSCGNAYWKVTRTDVHLLAKLILNSDHLEIRPIDSDWLDRELAAGRVQLPLKKSVPAIFLALPEQWVDFLEKYGDSEEAFPQKDALVFVRHKQEDTSAQEQLAPSSVAPDPKEEP